ncbi:M20/M25/M40 family metallo-hydrolase [Sphingomonas sp.]|jgi:acetylornithine deacetylase/succinyl-diaminopimelate desuccinylase-like protein|uniref:M20/M25/M40 family metallo-hydrolase n=1 Tax=Sphingomonas sp. TaxID=28214 RepID=UPI002DF5C042|nr:M20/M25/M40 family metallo-hydrolase [Sphingomonas sp.]HEV2569395.1 M20/M25/M40 family metallo-hydrolase [Sphingomonas sp.]
MRRLALALLLGAAAPSLAATPVPKVMASPAYKAAVAHLDREHDRIVEEIVTLTEIPAPPFKEEKRAKAYAEMLRTAGLADVELDEEGNAIGLWRGTGAPGRPLIVIAAHLDTVFPEETNVKVRREGTRLYAPGIGDDTRSLAVLLAYVRAMKAAGVKTGRDILFVGNVGEEGPGDLRGIRYLFTKGKYKDRVAAFFSMDGTDGARIVNGGTGSKRYRVTYKGPGGHSYGAFGLVNPMTAMSQTVVDLYRIAPPKEPKTTYSASVTGGGTSVNSIPHEVWMEFDMRSESAAELAKLEQRFLGIVQASVAAENGARSTKEGLIKAEPKLIGNRPAGKTPESAELVQVARAAVAAHGLKPEFQTSSTDANMPMSLGIPGITIGSGGSGGRAHALDEWIDVEKGASHKGMLPGLAMLLAMAELR